ncbi:MAG TPA: hypothetical protein VI893_09415 [Thermoplasmata archaeon]|nr:hypothetical protein [Thermoplasmata archaeon]
MVNLTLSMPEEIHRRMRDHPEIRWTHVMRAAVIEKLEILEREVREMSQEKRMRGYPTMHRIKNKVFREAHEVPNPDFDRLGI